MTDFFRFPQTPHLAWLGSGTPRNDKVMSIAEANAFLAGGVVIEEKLDGANLGISVDEDGSLRLQNRGQYLVAPFGGQFSRATVWLARHQDELLPALRGELILFGEWCAARHSVFYDHLPDWFIAFDVYDRAAERFWNTTRRDVWLDRLGISVVPTLARGPTALGEIEDVVISGTSRFSNTALEGLVIRRDGTDFLERRAKLVRPDFAQAIGEHWRSRLIEWNIVTHP